MSRKVGMKLVAASTIAMAIGCSGAVDTDEQQLENEPSIAGNDDEQDGDEPVEPTTNDITISGVSSLVSEPTNLKVSASTQTTITTEWGVPTKGKPESYLIFVNGEAKASTRNKKYVASKLACGTSYTLEVASRDEKKMASSRSKISGTTAACADATVPAPSSPTGYAAAVLKDAPVAYWRLNETTGSKAADSIGTNHGTYENGPKLGANGIDGAVGFDGADDVVTVADSADLRLNGSFTIEFLAKLGGDANSYPGILGKGSAASGNTGYIVYYSPGHKNPAFKRAGVDGLDTSDAGTLVADGFKHFAFTYDDAAATARWYVGGNLDRTINDVRFPINLDSSTFALGRGDSEGGKVQFGNEILDEVAVYKSALSAERVKAHFEASGLSTAVAPVTPVTPVTPVNPAPVPTNNGAFPIGLCAYKTQDFAKLQAMGMHHARMDQPSAQLIEQARTFGVEVLPIADYGFADLSVNGDNRGQPKPENRAAWAKRSVDTWRNMANPPKVIEVWNEPWHKSFYAGKVNPADYLELVKAFAAEAWKVWPNVTLLVSADAGMSDYPTFRKDLLAADKDKFLTDPRILPTTHNYVENRTPTQVTGNSCTYDLNRYQCAFADFKAHGHKNPQVWVTEFGWESSTAGGNNNDASVSEQVMGQYTIDALEMFRKSGMVAAAYAFMLNSNDKWNYNWLRPDNSEKPVVGMVKSYLATH